MQLPHIALSWTDALDVLLTAYVVYVVLLLIRGTRAVQILQGIALLLILRLVAQGFHLWTLLTIFNGLLIASGVAIPVVFQPDLRRALARLGTGGFIDRFGAKRGVDLVAELCGTVGRAAAVLSRSGIGAIIVVEQGTGLEEFVETGRTVDAIASTELLLSIFSPKSPLHDGAVIVRGDRVVAAGCFLPLSERAPADRRMGTRHRAALGISEQTDAVALLVSEETGDVEIARDGRLVACGRSPEEVASALKSVVSPPAPASAGSWIERVRTSLTRGNGSADRTDSRNFGLQATALVVAGVLWFTFNYLSASQDTYTKTIELNVIVRGVGSGLVATTQADRAAVELSGARTDLDSVTASDLAAFVDCSGKAAGVYTLQVEVAGRDADKIKAVDPPQAVVTVDRYAFRTVPVVARDMKGLELGNAVVAPSTIQVEGAASAVTQVVAAEVSVPEPKALPVGFAAEMKPVPVDDRMQPVAGVTALGVVSVSGPTK